MTNLYFINPPNEDDLKIYKDYLVVQLDLGPKMCTFQNVISTMPHATNLYFINPPNEDDLKIYKDYLVVQLDLGPKMCTFQNVISTMPHALDPQMGSDIFRFVLFERAKYVRPAEQLR